MTEQIKTYKVEYLFVIDAKEKILSSKKSFKHLLQTDDNIKITTQNIEYKEKTFKYQIQLDKEAKKIQNSFHLELECSKKADLIQFESLLKSVRTLIAKVSDTPPEILWDDIGIERANKAYPIINKTENLMRKLITKFMLVNVGQEWTKDAIPKEVINSRRVENINKKFNQNYLHDVDFIQLSYFLFNKYTTKDFDNIIEKLNSASNLDELDLKELKILIPKSNWERYFSDIVDCESESLEKDWGKLYLLRCDVAHNKFLGKTGFKEIEEISERLKTTLDEAIVRLNEVEVPEEQKENVRGDFTSHLNSILTTITRMGSAIKAAQMVNIEAVSKMAPAIKAAQMVNIEAVSKMKPVLKAAQMVNMTAATRLGASAKAAKTTPVKKSKTKKTKEPKK